MARHDGGPQGALEDVDGEPARPEHAEAQVEPVDPTELAGQAAAEGDARDDAEEHESLHLEGAAQSRAAGGRRRRRFLALELRGVLHLGGGGVLRLLWFGCRLDRGRDAEGHEDRGIDRQCEPEAHRGALILALGGSGREASLGPHLAVAADVEADRIAVAEDLECEPVVDRVPSEPPRGGAGQGRRVQARVGFSKRDRVRERPQRGLRLFSRNPGGYEHGGRDHPRSWYQR